MITKEDYLDLLFDEPYRIGHWVGFDRLTELNNEWMKNFIYRDDDQTLLAHRESYKTTTLSVAIAIIMILYPLKQIIFLRKTDTDVIEILRQVSNILKHPIILEIVRVLYDGHELELINESGGELNTSLNDSTRGGSQLIGLGILTSITGKHGDIIVTDDIVNIKDRISRAERERTKLSYMELQNIKNRGGRFINTGTPWHEEDAISNMPNIEKYDAYSTGLMTPEEIQDKKDKMTLSLFSANYELRHISDEDVMFTNPQIDDGRFTYRLFDGVCHIDAGYDGKDGTAFTILKRDKYSNKIYVFGMLRDAHVDDVLQEIKSKRILYRAGRLYNETNADKGYLLKEIESPKKGYHENMNKFIKISTYLKSNWKNIVFVKDTEPEYINQITDYNEFAEHDDAPDSLASLLRESGKSGGIRSTEGIM